MFGVLVGLSSSLFSGEGSTVPLFGSAISTGGSDAGNAHAAGSGVESFFGDAILVLFVCGAQCSASGECDLFLLFCLSAWMV